MKKLFLFFLIAILAACNVDEDDDGKVSITLSLPKKSNSPQIENNENATDSRDTVLESKENAPKTPPPIPALSTSNHVIANRYRDNGDGTVKDLETNLEWMHCSLGQDLLSTTCEGMAKPYKWNDAIEASINFTFAGHDDWHVPTVDELKTLIHCSSNTPKTWNDTGDKCKGSYEYPTIVKEAFPNTPNWYWSSSADAFLNSNAWYVFFNYGYTGSYSKGNSNHVRLVRNPN
jgi:Protein of unknown function (DUF1566)